MDLARRWEIAGSPLRPAQEDVEAYREAVADVLSRRPSPRVLILGVTPELHSLPWPEGTDLQAADRSQTMIDLVWPGPPDAVRLEEWTHLSLPGSSRDAVLCDGGFHLLAYRKEQEALVRALHRVISDDGCFIVRLFVPPDDREDPETVMRELREGGIENVNVLKLRLDMALQENPHDGVVLGDVWDLFHSCEPDPDALASDIGWSAEEAGSVEAYKGSTSRYHFVSVEQAEEMFCRGLGGFQMESVRFPTYALGERCPMVVFRRDPEAVTPE